MNEEIKAVIEGLLFVAGEEGMEEKQLLDVLEINQQELHEYIEAMKKEYDSPGRGMQLNSLAGGYQLTTKEIHAPYYKKLLQSPSSGTLSQASLESLAVIAYRQPVARMEIEDIRGVKTERPLRTLQSKGLIKEVGRQEGAGRAILYGTTKQFLEQFGLQSINDLPPLPEAKEDDPEEEFDLFFEKFQDAVKTEN
ncbi:SMC-Scp complex subunit ScpB [Alkalicoccus daliensis]|uniref:Segregation and condensation protein B n=1 Tax=Alkalicoccus daliensis TaxID=745820 RepID=A0A1H0AYW3_9BACI|nr:SMC-Scp complex subunit ScpB [Alkalicoccus daliensis]SDN38608.1 segregation and condensation protein B [Alkalicoccus daliensis]